MSLYLKYVSKTDLELVSIMEHPEDYTQSAIDVINEIFDDREIDQTELRKIVVEVNSKKAEAIIQRLDPLNDELEFHESVFLDSKEVKEIYIKALKEHMSRKEGFKFNVWLYAMGGG